MTRTEPVESSPVPIQKAEKKNNGIEEQTNSDMDEAPYLNVHAIHAKSPKSLVRNPSTSDNSQLEYRIQIGEISDCLSASPTFRTGVNGLEQEAFEAQKWISDILDIVDDYCQNNQLMTRILQVLGTQLSEIKPSVLESEDMIRAMKKFGSSLKGQSENQEVLNLQIEDGFKNRLGAFFKKEFSDLQRKKAIFHSSDKTLDKTTLQYSLDSSVRINRDLSSKFYQDQKDFHQETLNYVGQLESIEAKKTSVILENCLSLMYAQRSYFRKGYEMFNDLEPYMRTLASAVHSSQQKVIEREKRLKNKRTYAEAEAEIHFGRHLRVRRTLQDPTSFGSSKSGNLYVRVAKRVPTWEKAYFYVQKGMLLYHEYNSVKQAKYLRPIIAADLLITTVKRVGVVEDFRFCFEVISPKLHYVMCAQSTADMQEWIKSIQNAIKEAFEKYTPLQCPIPGPLSPELCKERNLKFSCLALGYAQKNRLGGTSKTSQKDDMTQFNDLSTRIDVEESSSLAGPELGPSTVRKRIPFKLPFSVEGSLSETMPTLATYVDNSILDSKRNAILKTLKELENFSAEVVVAKQAQLPSAHVAEVNEEETRSVSSECFVDAEEEFCAEDLVQKELTLTADIWGDDEKLEVLHGMPMKDIIVYGFPNEIRYLSWMKIAFARNQTTLEQFPYSRISAKVEAQLKMLNLEIPRDIDIFDREHRLGEVLDGGTRRILVWRNEIENVSVCSLFSKGDFDVTECIKHGSRSAACVTGPPSNVI